MTNRRSILFFLVGIALAGSLLWLLKTRDLAVDAATSLRANPVDFEPHEVDAISVASKALGEPVKLVRTADGWRLVAPFAAPADAAVAEKLVDALAQCEIGDALSAADVRAMERSAADFGLAPAACEVTLRAGARRCGLCLGAFTPARSEVYARLDGSDAVFTLPAPVRTAVPDSVDAFRRRTLFAAEREAVVAVGLRVPGSPYAKVVREGAGWRFAQPEPGPADSAAVEALVERLVSAQVAAFAPSDAAVSERLPAYGVDPETGLAASVAFASGATAQIVFGREAPVGTNLVWALARDPDAVVAVDAALAALCGEGAARLRDLRVFPLAAEAVKTLSVASGSMVWVLTQTTNRAWRLEAPVAAAADTVAAEALVARVLALKRDEVAASERDEVRLSLAGTGEFSASASVSAAWFGPLEALANLRSKAMLAFDGAAVRRISVKSAGVETLVAWDAERAGWDLEKGAEGHRVDPAAVKRLVAALADVNAAAVEVLAAAPADVRRCALDEPAVILAVDFADGASPRRNLLLGGAAPGGGRYATVGGADTIFILSRTTVAELTAPITE